MSGTLVTNQAHTQSVLLPAELWLEILEYLTVDDVASYRLVCKLFGFLSQRRMFRSFIAKKQGRSLNIDKGFEFHISKESIQMLQNVQMFETVQMFEFYSSESIARHVRYREFEGAHNISYICTEPNHAIFWPLHVKRDPAICHRFFEILPKFQNVSHLAIRRAGLNRFELEQLGRLPKLERLDITGCNSTGESTLPKLGLRLRQLRLTTDILDNKNHDIGLCLLLRQHYNITQLYIKFKSMDNLLLEENLTPLGHRLNTTVSVTIIGAP